MNKRNISLGVVVVLFAAQLLSHKAYSNGHACEFETFRTDGIIYLRRDTSLENHTLQFVSDDVPPTVESVHELVGRVDDQKWYTAIWAGSARSGTLMVTDPSANVCRLELPSYTARTKPLYDNVIVANPANIMSKVQEVNQSGGQVELVLLDGEYHAGDILITASDVNVVADNVGKAVINGESRETIQFAPIAGTEVYKTTALNSSFIENVRQVHADINLNDGVLGRDGNAINAKSNNGAVRIIPRINVERLPSVSTDGGARQWTEATLDASVNGGWFVRESGNQFELLVKMPNGTDPTGKVHVSGPFQKAFEFTGDNVWVEGLDIRFYGKIPPLPSGVKREDHDLVSGLRFSGSRIDVRKNRFKYNRGHSIVFGCENVDAGTNCASDVYTYQNRFRDNQRFLTYKQARDSDESGQELGRSLRPSERVMYWKTTGYTHKDNIHNGSLQGVVVVGANAGEITDNSFSKNRNMPVQLLDAEEIVNRLKPKVPGHSLTVAKNSFKQVGFSVPNNEEAAETGPAWWINNCVIHYGYIGNDVDGDTIGDEATANRYGVESTKPIGIHYLYNNVISSDKSHPTYNIYMGWTNTGKTDFAAGSKFYNNIWTSFGDEIHVEIKENGTTVERASLIWKGPIGPLKENEGIVLDDHLLNRTHWDYNQYWLSTGISQSFGAATGMEFEELRDRYASQYNFETHGSFSNPGTISNDCEVQNRISPLKIIPGVTNNQYLSD